MRVLVDGDRGSIGAVLVPVLLQAGYEVEGLDGIEELPVDMERIGLTAEDFEGERYVRLHRANRLRAEGRLDDAAGEGVSR